MSCYVNDGVRLCTACCNPSLFGNPGLTGGPGTREVPPPHTLLTQIPRTEAVTFEAPRTSFDLLSANGPPTRAKLCGQTGLLYRVGQSMREQTTFVWRCDRRWCSPGTSPLLLACKVAELYHLRQAVRLPKALPKQALAIAWLEVGCDDTLSVVLQPYPASENPRRR